MITYPIGAENWDGSESEDGEVSSWQPINLAPYLDGIFTRPEPGILYREDGVGLLYPGRVHWMHGEPESGKSWIAQIATAAELTAGGRVLYLDYESGPDDVIGRLLALGSPVAAIRDRLTYLRPDDPSMRPSNAAAINVLLSTTYNLAIIDGITDALGLDGVSIMDNDDVAAWMRRLPRRIARETGAAVDCIDHVTKDADSRSRFAIGSQAKMAGIDGAAYMVELVKPLGRGMVGILELRIVKDRPGSIRSHGGKYHKGSRAHEIARIIHDARIAQAISVSIRAPEGTFADSGGLPRTNHLTLLMERVSLFLEDVGDEWKSTSEIKRKVKGNGAALGEAIAVLLREGYIEHRTEGQSELYHSVFPFRDGTRSPFPGHRPGEREERAGCTRSGTGQERVRNGSLPAEKSGMGEGSATRSQDRGTGEGSNDHTQGCGNEAPCRDIHHGGHRGSPVAERRLGVLR